MGQTPQPQAGQAQEEVTLLLGEIAAGMEGAKEKLIALVYNKLHQMAEGMMGWERSRHTLQPTGLVHEAYFKLFVGRSLQAANRAYFFGAAANAMRQVLVDYARRRAARPESRRVPLLDGILESVRSTARAVVASGDHAFFWRPAMERNRLLPGRQCLHGGEGLAGGARLVVPRSARSEGPLSYVGMKARCAMTEGMLKANALCPSELAPPMKAERNYGLLIAGLLLALIAYVALVQTAQALWVSETINWDSGVRRLILAAVVYAAGMVLFGYEYKREDWKAGCRFAAIWGSVALALVLLWFVGIFKLLASTGFGFEVGGGGGGGDDDSDSDGESGSESSDSESGDSSGGTYTLSLNGPSTDPRPTCQLCGLPIQEGNGGKCLRCEY